MRDERKEFKIRLTEEEWEEVRRGLFERKKKQQEAGHAALFAWLRGSVLNSEQAAPHPASAKQAAPPGRNAEWHRLLDIILEQGTPEDVTGIQANLRWGANAVEGRHSAPFRRKKKAG